MKKLLCVLLFGMVFGQALIETRGYIINLEGLYEYEEITINMMELIGEAEGDFYLGDVVQSDFTFSSSFGIPLGIKSMCGEIYPCANITSIYNNFPFSPTDGLFTSVDTHHFKFTAEKPDVEFTCYGCNQFQPPDEFHLWIHISGEFSDTDVGLQGDMNDDDSLDVLDVVMLVDVIINGGVGDVGDLINIVTG